MAKTIESMDFHVPITPYEHEGQKYDILEVVVAYRKGRGFVVTYQPGWKTPFGWGCAFDFSNNPLTSATTVFAKQALRNSAKEIETMHASLQLAREAIATLFDKRDWLNLDSILKTIARYGYNAQVEATVKKLLQGDAKEEPITKRSPFKEMKQKHPDAVLLFRCGDFYETYDEDADACADILGLTITTDANGGKVCGFPYHALDAYLPKLIRAGKRIAICDKLEKPAPKVKRGTNETINDLLKTKNNATMEKKTTAQDYVGKTIIVGDGVATIEIKSAQGDIMQGEFKRGDAPAVPMQVPISDLQKMFDDGVWKLSDGTAPKAKAEEKPKTEAKPKAEKPKAEKPKTEAKPKAEKPKGKAALTYETYTNKKGKTCARVIGFKEDDAAYKEAESIHASASYTTKKGVKTLYLCFGPRYAAAAKSVCEALNAGKTLADCKAIIDSATAERAAKREEWKEKRNAKTFTEQEVAAMFKAVADGKPIPDGIKKILDKAS